MAIARYIARKFKLAGKDDLEALKCDVVVDTLQEINEEYYRVWFHIKDEKLKQEEQLKFKTEILPAKLKGLDKLMHTFGNGVWAVGDNATWADLAMYDTLQNVLKIDDQALNNFAIMKTNFAAVEKLPKLTSYLANRKESPF